MINYFDSFAGQQDKEFNIMTINYTSYFVSYGCLSQDENLKCNKPHSTLWTRSKAMSAVDFAEAKRIIVELCLNYDLFVSVDQSNGKYISLGSLQNIFKYLHAEYFSCFCYRVMTLLFSNS